MATGQKVTMYRLQLLKYHFLLLFFFKAITVSGITAVNLQALETEFGFSSKSVGFIMTGNDISALFLVTAVSFFGTKASKPKWMGIGSIITGNKQNDVNTLFRVGYKGRLGRL